MLKDLERILLLKNRGSLKLIIIFLDYFRLKVAAGYKRLAYNFTK